MENQEQTTDLVPKNAFRQAFAKHFKCKQSDFNLEMITENLSAKVLYNQLEFEIRTYNSLLLHVREMLTNKDHAQHVDITILVEVFECLVLKEQFYLNLLELLIGQEQLTILQHAIVIYGQCSKSHDAFWTILNRVDYTGQVFGNAVIAAAQTGNVDQLAEDMLDGQLSNGVTFYPFGEGDVIEPVEIPIKEQKIETFYIYQVVD